MQCILNIDIDVLAFENSIPYKYVIRSRDRKDANPYEILHTPKKYGVVVNRCLVVPKATCQPRGGCSEVVIYKVAIT